MHEGNLSQGSLKLKKGDDVSQRSSGSAAQKLHQIRHNDILFP